MFGEINAFDASPQSQVRLRLRLPSQDPQLADITLPPSSAFGSPFYTENLAGHNLLHFPNLGFLILSLLGARSIPSADAGREWLDRSVRQMDDGAVMGGSEAIV